MRTAEQQIVDHLKALLTHGRRTSNGTVIHHATGALTLFTQRKTKANKAGQPGDKLHARTPDTSSDHNRG